MIVANDAFEQADAEVVALHKTFLERASPALPATNHARIAPDGFDRWREIFRIIQANEVWQTFGAFVEKHQPRMGPGIRERMQFETVASDLTRRTSDR